MKTPTLPKITLKQPRIPQLPRLVLPTWKQVIVSRYLWSALIAAIWLIFFDNYSYFRQGQMAENIEALKQDKRYYEAEVKKVDYQSELIFHDKDELERYAREHYYMHRTNEDVFIVSDEPERPLPKPEVIESVGTFKKPKEAGPRKPFEAVDTLQPVQGKPNAALGGDE